MGVVTTRDPFLIFSLPKISLEWLKLDFKFGVYVDRSTSQPIMDNKLSRKGRGHCYVTLTFGR